MYPLLAVQVEVVLQLLLLLVVNERWTGHVAPSASFQV